LRERAVKDIDAVMNAQTELVEFISAHQNVMGDTAREKNPPGWVVFCHTGRRGSQPNNVFVRHQEVKTKRPTARDSL
jgi:hypothetical protein